MNANRIHSDNANRILQGFERLRKLLTAIEAETRQAEDAGAIELAIKFVSLRQIKDEFDDVLKVFNTFYEPLKVERLPAVFERQSVTSIPLKHGYRVGVSYRTLASIRQGHRDPAYHWLRANGMPDLITTTVNSNTLSAAARELAKENKELPSEDFNVLHIATTSVTSI